MAFRIPSLEEMEKVKVNENMDTTPVRINVLWVHAQAGQSCMALLHWTGSHSKFSCFSLFVTLI